MKSIKLASGFAVSALALAIAGQAAAETTADVEFTGSVQVKTVFDLENETRTNTAPGLAEYATDGEEGDDDWFNLQATWSISNGPFSGDLIVGYIDQEDGPDVDIDNLMVEEGPISFGQIGSVADTVGKLEGLTDFARSDEVGFDEGLGVEAAFRYTVEEFGLKVQGEGADPQDFGFGLGIHQDLDVAEVWADFQYREPQGGNDDIDAVTGFGLAVEASPVDMVTLEAAFRNNSAEQGGDGDSAWATKLTVDATEEISVFGQLASISVEDEHMAARFGAEGTFAPITVEGWYAINLSDDADDSGVVFAKVSYAEGPWGAYAEVEQDLETEGTVFELGGDYTTDSGIVYGAKYMNENEEAGGPVSAVEAFAQYSF